MLSLEEYQRDIIASNTAAGWYEDNRTLGEECALLHSEVSEMFEAYRDNGLEPFFHQLGVLGLGSGVLLQGNAPEGVKPEGVGSEIADVLIRLLDACHRLYADLSQVIAYAEEATTDVDGTFGDTVTKLHSMISYLAITGNPALALGAILAGLQEAAKKYEINLFEEVDRKLLYNKTRSYRHGGKKI